MKKCVYIVIEEMYGDWASENGACNMLGVYENILDAKNKIKSMLALEKSDSHIIDNHLNLENAEKIVDNTNDFVSFYIYENEYDYNNGYSKGVLTLTKRVVE